MPRLTKIVTHLGDRGETYLVNKEKVSKASRRVKAYGDVDELNSCIGMVRSIITQSQKYEEINNILKEVQEHLFLLGAELAHPKPPDDYPKLQEKHLKFIEKWCETINNQLPFLKEFILPAGSFISSLLHFTRTVARRAERSIVHLNEKEHLRNIVIKYINRLSDLFFILARYTNKLDNVKEEEINFREVYNDRTES